MHMSPEQHLMSAPAAIAALNQPGSDWLVIDCSFDLAQTDAGADAFLAARLPGSIYLHLDRDLSAPKTGRNGRHPLPSREAFAREMTQRGLRAGRPVLVYDRQGGMYAARLWWMLRWIGHATVSLLDGGLPAWTRAGGATATGQPESRAGSATDIQAHPADTVNLPPSLENTIDRASLKARLGQTDLVLVDARSPDRFRGENETLDPVGGHIPGARNRFFKDNLQADGTFKAPATLRQEWSAVLDQSANGSPPVMQCGSGVTACHNILALAVAGLGTATLYPGSWSEWCAHADSPIATGAA